MSEAGGAGGFDVNADLKEVSFWAMAQIWRWFECEGARNINQMPEVFPLQRAVEEWAERRCTLQAWPHSQFWSVGLRLGRIA